LRNWLLAAVVAGVAAAVTAATTNLINSGGQALSDAIAPAPALTTPVSEPQPFAWTVSFASRPLNQCHRWMFARPIQEIPFRDLSTGDYENAGKWALEQGGVDITAATYTLTLQGLSDTDVVIRNIRIKLLSQQAPAHGTTIALGVDCGGTVAIRRYEVDLGAQDPQLMPVTAAGRPVPPQEQYVVSKSEPEVFQLSASLGNHPDAAPASYTFVYQFDWSQGGRSGTVDIATPAGKPFTVTAGDKNPYYVAYNGAWTDVTTIR
jgi:hypothetical protein